MKLVFRLDGVRRELETPSLSRLLDVLREGLGAHAPKEGCGEGECGACAVLLDGRLVNACLLPAWRAHGRSVWTAEGLGSRETPDPVQAAFVAEGAVQCGFCIPGLITASRALLDVNAVPSRHEIREGLAGNLCRCTGYERIVRAVDRAAAAPRPERDDSAPGVWTPPVCTAGEPVVHLPETLDAALELLAEDVLVVSGASDLGVDDGIGGRAPRAVLDLERVEELRAIEVDEDHVAIGAAVPYAEIIRHAVVAERLPALVAACRLIGAPAIQNVGTLGGNLANASPGADAVPALIALDAVLLLASRDGVREVPADAFTPAYRETVLRPDELLAAVLVPLPAPDVRQAFFKAGTRSAQSIARVNLACRAAVVDGRLHAVRLAAGSVGPTALLLCDTSAWLEGRDPSDPAVREEAARLAAAEVKPIDDVRSTEVYRRTVTGNLLKRFLLCCVEGTAC